MKRIVLLFALALAFVGCSKPKTGICSHCPLWFVDPICLFGKEQPDAATTNPLPPPSPPPVESDLVK